MNLLMTETAKYIMIVALGLYVLESFVALFWDKWERKGGLFTRQYVYILLIQVLGLTSLYISNEDVSKVFFYFLQILMVFLVNRISLFLYPRSQKMLVNHLCLFLAIGCMVLTRLDFDKAQRQIGILAIALAIFMITPFWIEKIKFWKHFSFLYGAIGIAALYVVFAFGDTVYGSKLTMDILGLTFQPSEFVKLVFAFFIAGLLYKTFHFGKVVLATFMAALYVLLLVISRDLGSALIFFLAYIAMLFVATGKKRYYILGILGGGVSAYIASRFFSHVQTRIAVWLDPWSDLDNTGYQLTQSLFGIGTGGWLGMGFGKGKPDMIPFVEEDFVFSAVAEELGVVFGLLLISAFLACVSLFLKIAFGIQDPFWRIVAVGIATSFGSQVVLTIGGGSGLIPLTGVTLPLISNGGSSGMATVFLFGVMMGISLVAAKERRKNLALAEEAKEENEEVISTVNLEFEKNRPRRNAIVVIGIIFAAFYVAMIVNILFFVLYKSHEVIGNSYNTQRLEILAENTIRGNIYGLNGELLATTVVDANGQEIREYPYEDMFAHAVGYDCYGGYGVEALAATSLIVSDLSLGERIANEMNGEKNPGNNVYTSLDPRLQEIAYDSLGLYRGAVIVTEVETGRILAMVSKPDFNPEEIPEIWDTLIADDESSILVNRVTQGLYPPGSTFKIFTALEYIRQNPDSYDSYHYQCNGYFALGEYRIQCYHGSVHGSLDLMSSFAKSCNSSFANIGILLDRREFADTLLSLGFNEELPIALPSNPSHISMREQMSEEEIMQTSIGQSETLITPMHLNMVTAAIANEGVMMTPYLIDRVESADGNVLQTYSPVEYDVVMTLQETEILIAMMQEVVEHGTAGKLAGQSYTVAGKTGSAEYSDIKGQSHAWFTGFAPVENPEIAVTVILEGAGSGGDYAAPIARRIFSCYFGE